MKIVGKDVSIKVINANYKLDADNNIINSEMDFLFDEGLIFRNKNTLYEVKKVKVTRDAIKTKNGSQYVVNSNYIMDPDLRNEDINLVNVNKEDLINIISNKTMSFINTFVDICDETTINDKLTSDFVTFNELSLVKRHFEKSLLKLYPEGFDNSTYSPGELRYYHCIKDVLEHARNLKDINEIVSKKHSVSIETYNKVESNDLRYEKIVLNALMLNIIVNKEFEGSRYKCALSTGLGTMVTFERYCSGYMSSYNNQTIDKINKSLGYNYLIRF